MAIRQRSCKERWQKQKDGRMEDLRTLWDLYCGGNEEGHEDLGQFHEYGLSFDYVPPGTFGDDQREPYWRYQISWGGPSDEFRFYSGGPEYAPYRIEYWFLDWGDGHGEELKGNDSELMEEIWSHFSECGTTEWVQREATKD